MIYARITGGSECRKDVTCSINACHYMIEGLNAVTNSQGIKLTDLKFIASHQANKRIMATVARQIDFPEDHMLSNIEEGR